MPPKRYDDATEKALHQMRTRMKAIEANYLRTKEYLKSPEWAVKRDMTLIRLSKTLAPVLGKDGIECAFILGKVRAVLEEIQEISDVITEYEDLQTRLEEFYARDG